MVNCLKSNSVRGFHNIKITQSKRRPQNLKKLLTKAEYGGVLLGTFNFSNKRCECCNYPFINDHYTFKNVQVASKFKNRFTCDSFNPIYVAICDKCKEKYIEKTREEKFKLRDRVTVYHGHIPQPQYQQLNAEGHLRICDNSEFQIFPFAPNAFIRYKFKANLWDKIPAKIQNKIK